MQCWRLPMVVVLAVVAALAAFGRPDILHATDHPPCSPSFGQPLSTCLVVDAETFTPGEQSELFLGFGEPFPSEFDVDFVLRPDSSQAASVFAFDIKVIYDTSHLQASAPVIAPAFASSDLVCAYPAPTADFDGNPETGDALISCFSPTNTPVVFSSNAPLARVHFDVVSLGAFATPISIQAGAGNGSTGDVACFPTGVRNGGCLGATIIQEQHQFPDTDHDGFNDDVDNCPSIFNVGQENADEVTDLSPWGKVYNDVTWPNGDRTGDACDNDTDNDDLANLAETGAPCAPASGPTDPFLRDTDGDGVHDGAECDLGFDPASAASKPPPVGFPAVDPDTDGDGLRDSIETRVYNSDISDTDTDNDGCPDSREAASINGDRNVNSTDLSQVAQHFSTAPDPKYIPQFDMHRDGRISSIDLSFVAQRFGNCR